MSEIRYARRSREDGSIFVTSPDLPGFSWILFPGDGDDALESAVKRFRRMNDEDTEEENEPQAQNAESEHVTPKNGP